jgi:hypothetical protein
MNNSSRAPFDPIRFSADLYAILSKVTVNGPENIHNMDMALNGLLLLRQRLSEAHQSATVSEQQKREEI